jgi:hypothetical protein
MKTKRLPPGVVRDAVHTVMQLAAPEALTLTDLHSKVVERVGQAVSESSVRSSLLLHPDTYVRTSRGHYRFAGNP